MVITGPLRATGGRTIFTLEPSSSLVSTMGELSFTILLDIAAIFCAMSASFSSLSNCPLYLIICPFFSIKMLRYPLIIISVMLSSSRSSCRISSFLMELNSLCFRLSFSVRGMILF